MMLNHLAFFWREHAKCYRIYGCIFHHATAIPALADIARLGLVSWIFYILVPTQVAVTVDAWRNVNHTYLVGYVGRAIG